MLVVSGPSGVGKTSVVNALMERTNFHFSVSMTTRAARPTEREGVDYIFVTRDEFQSAIASGELLEWAEYGGNLYGTPRARVVARLEAGQNVLLDIENEGARQIKRTFPEAVLVFLMPPSLDELEKRLRNRGDTTEAAIQSRLAVATAQIGDAEQNFDHIVVNRDIETAAAEVVGILAA